MSILIKGMEMPINCETCPFDDGTYCQAYPKSAEMIYDIANGIPTWCPLIEIPPHGRLIDADAIEKKSDLTIANMADWESIVDAVNNIINCWELIKNAPTIIPAEEGE